MSDRPVAKQSEGELRLISRLNVPIIELVNISRPTTFRRHHLFQAGDIAPDTFDNSIGGHMLIGGIFQARLFGNIG